MCVLERSLSVEEGVASDKSGSQEKLGLGDCWAGEGSRKTGALPTLQVGLKEAESALQVRLPTPRFWPEPLARPRCLLGR